MSLSPTKLDLIRDKFVAILQHTEAIKVFIDKGRYVRAKAYVDRQQKCCAQGMALLDILLNRKEKS